MSDTINFRCCICPMQDNPSSFICPPGPFKPGSSLCRFVKMYIDNAENKYRVGGMGIGNVYKIQVQQKNKTGNRGWKALPTLASHYADFDTAQTKLNKLAEKNNWSEYHQPVPIRCILNAYNVLHKHKKLYRSKGIKMRPSFYVLQDDVKCTIDELKDKHQDINKYYISALNIKDLVNMKMCVLKERENCVELV